MKVIIITSDKNTLQIKPIKIAKSLLQNGYDVKILTWDREGKKCECENVNGVNIHLFRFKTLGFSSWCLSPYYLVWWIYVFIFLLKNNADIYHVENLYNFIPVFPIKIIKRKKIIYDISDFFADSFDWPKFIRKLVSNFENFCLGFADGIIIVDKYRRKQISNPLVRNLAIVMNCPQNITRKQKIQKIEEDFVLYYGGWITETRGIKQICRAIQDLEGVRLIIAGFGPDEKKLMPIFQKQKNIEFKGLLNKIESLEWTQKADLILGFYDPKIPINRLASPNKLFDAMMCGTPILANSEALPVAAIIGEEKCGSVVPYNDIERIRNVISWFRENPNKKLEMGQNGRKAFEREYNWTEMESRLLELYHKVCFTNMNNTMQSYY